MSGFKQFLHYGPLIALGIIKCVTVMTLYMNAMWWPPLETFWGFINQAVFLVVAALTLRFYILATTIGPGYLPRGWEPRNPDDKEHLLHCDVCAGYKAPRAHHCKKCRRCVKKMDHHCPWINNCVGWANHGYFISFIGFAIMGCLHGSIILLAAFYRGINRSYYLNRGMADMATVQFSLASLIWCIFSLGLSIGVVLALSLLFFFQIKSISDNQTNIEEWIVETAANRRRGGEPLRFPYDLGKRENFFQVVSFSCKPIGNGIDWPIADGCDKYALTKEQKKQRDNKRDHSRTYKVTRPYSGRFLPLFSQGVRVCLALPCSDEARIKLENDDIVRVTRWRKYWLFGDLVIPGLTPLQRDDAILSGRLRGWFPRRCAVEFIEPAKQRPAQAPHHHIE